MSNGIAPGARALTMDEAAVALSIGRAKLYDMVSEKKLLVTKLGRRSVISIDQIDRLLGKVPD